MKLFSKLFSLSAITLAFSAVAAMAEEPPPRGGVGKITIITDPPNSEVYLGGELIGKSPITARDYPSGRYTLVITDQGYELVNQRFNVWPNKVNTFNAATTIPKGNIEVTTVPGKCIIYVDGENADKTDGAPLTIQNLDAGDHMVRAECNNGRSGEELVKVEGEKTAQITIDTGKKKKK